MKNISGYSWLLVLAGLAPLQLQYALGQTNSEIPYDTLFNLGDRQKLYFKYIPAGNFWMGSPETEPNRDPDEGPVHKVEITRDFYISIYEITQEQWETVMGYNPSVFRTLDRSPIHPVESVSWDECQEFARKLSDRFTGTFRLPTESEWEYACRAGTSTPYYWGEKMAESGASEYTWANSRSFAMTNPVGQKKPNPWGLYDISGNVWEWCSDWYGPYSESAQTDPQGPEIGKLKVFRGGSWYDFFESHRSANRHKHKPDERYSAIGLRLVWEKE